MKKTLVFAIVALSFALLLVSCGQKHPAISVARKFLDYMAANDAKGAYNFFTTRIKNETPFGKYEELLTQIQPPKPQDGTENQPWLAEGEKPKTVFTLERFDDSIGKAYVYGDLDQPQVGKATFRIKMLEEDGKWLVDSLLIELENVMMPGFYSNRDLSQQALQHFNWMMDGQADKMYENASRRVRETYPKDVFAVEAVGTSTGKIPRKEGFSFEIHVAFANDFGKGYVVGEILYVGNSMTEFELPFVLEDGVWKADFSKVTPK